MKTIVIDHPFFRGFYGSVWEEEFNSTLQKKINNHGEYEKLNCCEDDFDLDYSGYKLSVAQEYAECFKRLNLPKFINSVEFDGIRSPRWYNFENDTIRLKLELSDDWRETIVEFMLANKEKLTEIIKNDWTSYSGFISYMSNDFDEWLEEIEKENTDDRYIEIMIASMLYECDNNYKFKMIGEIMTDVFEETSPYEYITLKEKED